ncbi:MAG: GNAT family N-acetyltransferase [Candidatus Riflebacteria bacterium]|nr:GNAT family N-acetyltransferase [Candidatus Riflebacteria bacterium]
MSAHKFREFTLNLFMHKSGEMLVLTSWRGAPVTDGPPLPWDVYFEEAWLRNWGRPGSESLIFSYHKNGRIWVHPIVRLPISGTDLYDIESAWGYGGPLSNTEDPDFLLEAGEVFTEWAVSERIVCAFTRFHAPLANHRYCVDPDTMIVPNRAVISIPLKTQDEKPVKADVLRAAMKSSFRRGVRKACDYGLRFTEIEPEAYLPAFMILYNKTMDRVSATPDYYVDSARVKNLFCDPFHTRMFGVFDGDRFAAGAIILMGSETMHYHLGASDPELLFKRPNNLLFYGLTLWAAERGTHRCLHLGGGDDSLPDNQLLRFKRSIGGVESIYYTGTRIFLRTYYDELCHASISKRPGLALRLGTFLKLYRL